MSAPTPDRPAPDELPEHPYRSPAGLTPARVVAFSDGVFAIALTLLVLNLEVPPGTTDDTVADALGDQGETFLAYGITFAVLSVFWLLHHRVFSHIRRVNSTLLVMNLVFLALVTLLPFPTELMGDFPDSAVATVLYASLVSLCSLTATVLAGYAFSAGLTGPELSEIEVTYGRYRSLALVGIFVASMPLAFVDPTLAQLSWILGVPVSMGIDRARSRRLAVADERPSGRPSEGPGER